MGSTWCIRDGWSSGCRTSRWPLRRMVSALRPGGVLLIEEPDFVTIYGAGEPPAVRRVFVAAMAHLESTCPVEL